MPTEEIAKEKYAIKKGEKPKTHFIDNLDAVKVYLIDYPDYDRLKEVFVNFSTASWERDFYNSTNSQNETDSLIQDLINGNIFAQGLEHPKFAFRVEGLSLHGTHSLVRNRIGICYLQRSLAVSDLRHEDILVPRSFTKHPKLLEKYKEWVIIGKQLYSEMLDTGDIANTDARFCLPKTIPSWIYVSVNLATLISLVAKRLDSQEEHPEMNEMSKQMVNLVVEKFPYMKNYFASACDSNKCLHQKPGYRANCIFKRDSKHSASIDNWTLHDKTKSELMLDCDKYLDEYYVSDKKVDRGES